MKSLLTITHLLMPFLVGSLIGSLIFGNGHWKLYLFLIIIDIVVGVTLQYVVDKPFNDAMEHIMKISRLEELTEQQNEKEKTPMETEEKRTCENWNDTFERLYDEFEKQETEVAVENIYDHEAGEFLVKTCKEIPFGPRPYMLLNCNGITSFHLKNGRALLYSFFHAGIAQISGALLVCTNPGEKRLFVIEPSFDSLTMLCEYKDGMHVNYGSVELTYTAIADKIDNILSI